MRPSDATLLGSPQPCLSHTSVTHSGLMKATAALIHVDAFTISITRCTFTSFTPTFTLPALKLDGTLIFCWKKGGVKMHTYLFISSLMSTKSTIKGKLAYVSSSGRLGPCLWVRLLDWTNCSHFCLQWQWGRLGGQSQQCALRNNTRTES